MNPPQVLLEASFLAAVATPSHPRHADCAATYLRLLDDYEHERVLLVALDPHLPSQPPLRRGGIFAPVDRLHVGLQHRRAARRVPGHIDPELAITLVMCHRHKVRRVATLRDDIAAYDLELVDLALPGGVDRLDDPLDERLDDESLPAEPTGPDGTRADAGAS